MKRKFKILNKKLIKGKYKYYRKNKAANSQ